MLLLARSLLKGLGLLNLNETLPGNVKNEHDAKPLCNLGAVMIIVLVMSPGARGEADAQNITVLAMWMIEHPGTEEEDEPRSGGGGGNSGVGGSGSSCHGATGKSLDRSPYLCSPGDMSSVDPTELEEGFTER